MVERSLTPIAVIGMGCRLPGGIESPQRLWESLLRGADLVTEVPVDRWDADEYYDPEPGVPGRSVSKWGGFLDDVAGFDAEFFGISEREATAIDPQHRLLLESSWEAIEHAGIDPATLAGTRTGVFVGMTHNDYQLVTADADAIAGPYGFTGSNYGLASGRIAFHLGAHGPACTVDSACSSGLLAVHMACRSLHDGESSLALAGGVNILLEPRKLSSGSAQGMLSATGRCRAFDADADGFVSGEAAVMLLFKRLPDALRDGDRVLGVVRGTATNQDGRTVNIATPSQTAQTAVYRTALDAAGIDPATVGYVEAHGTGTSVGDPIEYASLADVYGTEAPCALGSAKTNFGHSQSASGVVGLMKAVLALGHGEVPPNLHFRKLSDETAQIDTALFVPQEVTSWPQAGDHPRRAAVSSYGLSGTNVHIVLEQAPAQAISEQDVATAAGPWLVPLSATSPEALCSTASQLADWVDAQSGLDVRDLAYTLGRRRAHRTVRTAVLAGTTEELVTALRGIASGDTAPQATAPGSDRGPVWVFSGQGSQWASMGEALIASEPVFAAALAEIEPLIAAESGFSVTEALSAAEAVAGIDRVQPTVFALQVALARTLAAYGVRPAAVIGHSMGEVAAAVISGAHTLEDGVKVICRRSRLMQRIADGDETGGAMASVELPAQQVLSELAARGAGDVVLSVIASPQSAVIGGARSTITTLVGEWEARGIMAREVAVEVASHSPQVDPILDELTDALEDLEPAEPLLPYYSATLYDPREPADYDAYYWADNLRHAVRFAAAVQAALEDGHRVFAELSPHPLLIHAVDQNAKSLDVTAVALATMRRGQELPHGLREVLADLYGAGAAIDFSALYPHGRLVDAPLPVWTHRQLMLDRETPRQVVGAITAAHPLLGAHVRIAEDPEHHAWQADVGTDSHPWLADHQIHHVAAYPAAAFCEMAVAAARAVLGEAAEVRDVSFEAALLLDGATTIASSAVRNAPSAAQFTVHTLIEGERVRHAAATLAQAGDVFQPAPLDIPALLTAHPHTIDGPALRTWFDERGVQYGPAFAGLDAVHTSNEGTSVLAEVALPGSLRSQQGAYGIQPALLDACFQAVGAHPNLQADSTGILMLPLGVRQVRLWGSARSARYCHIAVTTVTTSGVEANLDILDESGVVLMSLTGLQLGTGRSASARQERTFNDRLLGIDWHREELPDVHGAGDGRWLVISTSRSTDERSGDLASALRGRGADVSIATWPVEDIAHQAITGVVAVVSGHGAEAVSRLVDVGRCVADIAGAPPRMYALTSNAQSVTPDDEVNLDQAGVRGLMRVLGVEHPGLRATQIDVDDHTEIDLIAAQLMTGSDEDETAWRDGGWYVARLNPSPVRPDDRYVTTVKHDSDGMRLRIRKPGDLQSLELVAVDRTAPGPGQIEVSVSASNLNFADVLVAYGRYPSFEGRMPELGGDFAGVVTRVGPGVTTHQMGDRVAGITADGAWATFVNCDADLAVTLPAGLTEDRAAAVPSAHATAWYSLHDLARISSADKVLIHSATGGVGQAAIAIARAAGAQIFATAGSAERRELLRSMGIDHVYDSRSVEFADQIRRDTDGYGVDIVLNSLPGAAQQAGLELLSFGGRFVELGKRDIYGDNKIGLYAFRRNLSFFAVDLALLTLTRPDVVRRVLATVFDKIAAGDLPLPETTHYPLTDAATAIRAMGAAEHTGKLVVDVPREGDSRVVVPPQQAVAFRNDGAYIISGGMGGLGLYIAEKLADLGCGRIVLTGRSAPGAEALAAIDRIRRSGAEVEVCLGDISDADAAERAVAVATSSGRPVRGVLHAAAVVEDAALANITDNLISRCWAPKVTGAWNLHDATVGQPLDWFCMFSSAAAMVGSPGQGAYAAANSWLDAFAHWRRAHGLPANTIAWGAWAEIGRGQAVAQNAAMAIAPRDGAFALESLLRLNRGYTGYAPIAGVPWLTEFAQHSKFAEAFRSLGDTRSQGSAFLLELRTLAPEEWGGRLRRLIVDQIGVILRRTVDPDRPIAEYGLDSLGVLEVRTRIEAETGVRVATTDITTVRALAENLASVLTEELLVDGGAH
ncbi:sulfolipid-1 biosynthesis phthioceranic/hydroxyphthioceranic acid synthase [Mycobacterium sp. 236(2023)]|uniref:sulfolipid-1 biosynthesis phthioceranic/hydroxyphthioceranic acid synthase n=1 Tax=Mycobacterium sp. 236(2023) TaxID=3038163 RepID=UPI00241544E6|nr:sulfolipid-1 biosynthesis phthioceranic/hydroxyphthioceranic acid synthase [Mycobacterium sp. 236(2023)]MDG4668992.1 sulfolipid-1 biosynthesis phthioceranic/hydroxyphthioceranic acid synthase [Mycobacterium sp. 236(2023)]